MSVFVVVSPQHPIITTTTSHTHNKQLAGVLYLNSVVMREPSTQSHCLADLGRCFPMSNVQCLEVSFFIVRSRNSRKNGRLSPRIHRDIFIGSETLNLRLRMCKPLEENSLLSANRNRNSFAPERFSEQILLTLL